MLQEAKGKFANHNDMQDRILMLDDIYNCKKEYYSKETHVQMYIPIKETKL